MDVWACAANARCPRYVTRFLTRGAFAAEDFFTVPLWREPLVVCAFPPGPLFGPVLAYLRACAARAVVVVPWDVAAPWWWPSLPRPSAAGNAAPAVLLA